MKDLQALLYGASAVAREADLQLFLCAEIYVKSKYRIFFCENTEEIFPPSIPPLTRKIGSKSTDSPSMVKKKTLEFRVLNAFAKHKEID